MKPNKKIDIAKGIVSRIGAFELISPSLFKPLLLFMNEPNESPIKHAIPNEKPRIHAANEPIRFVSHFQWIDKRL